MFLHLFAVMRNYVSVAEEGREELKKADEETNHVIGRLTDGIVSGEVMKCIVKWSAAIQEGEGWKKRECRSAFNYIREQQKPPNIFEDYWYRFEIWKYCIILVILIPIKRNSRLQSRNSVD